MEGNKPRASTMPTDALGIDWLEDDEFIARMEKAIMEGDVAEILKLTGAEEIFEEAKRQVCSPHLSKLSFVLEASYKCFIQKCLI